MDAYLEEEQLVFFTCFIQNPNTLDFEMRKQGINKVKYEMPLLLGSKIQPEN
jgi:hypothetical protein